MDRLEQGGHLLQPDAFPECHVDCRQLDPRPDQRVRDFARGHVEAQDERASSQLGRQALFERGVLERSLALDVAALLEARRDVEDRVPRVDVERRLSRIGARRRHQDWTEILPHEIPDEPDPKHCVRVVPRPAHDRRPDERPERRQHRDENDDRQQPCEQEETHEARHAWRWLVVASRALRHRGSAATVGRPPDGHCRLPRGWFRLLGSGSAAVADRHRLPLMRGFDASGRAAPITGGSPDRRASSSSCRMIAAASRSTRSR